MTYNTKKLRVVLPFPIRDSLLQTCQVLTSPIGDVTNDIIIIPEAADGRYFLCYFYVYSKVRYPFLVNKLLAWQKKNVLLAKPLRIIDVKVVLKLKYV